MRLLDEIRASWGWTGIEPLKVLGENDFGNLIVKDIRGYYWRICPEDPYCKVVATSREELDRLSNDQEFLADWTMRALVAQASRQFGALPPGKKFCLKIPGILGGEYGGDNLSTISFEELIRASGHIAKQIADLPDGAKVRLVITD
ncbi:T6SS immunity protein Tdi1 domain-containing protein [Massilia sp. IC2-476]|uniref:T6SS immunity protein Tdi1 domain-containing protein n=1 Tax=Massilia sp. IC2-476 TaxID=2887199 RepID=UPI001D102701|nr:T6SS immunity protein Tdi1 domain-containing protein [Massilia sp. IC2-476]MCC2971081.1 DUF1851 domain-containing protein [Massilia sp. IC2-476]